MPPPSTTPSPGPATPLGAHDPVRLGPHRLVGRLASGGMGTVYLARTRFGRRVAVKAVHPELADEPEFRARFAREIGALHRLRTPYVPRYYGADPQADIPWLATAYVSGPTLRRQVEGVGPLRGGALTGLTSGVAAALADIHGAGLVHRDLKPSNVILSSDGPRVLDFGLALTLDGSARPQRSGGTGTPGWIAPERLRGAPATAASDVFSWGQLAAFAATGRNPFGAGNADTVSQRLLRGDVTLTGVSEELLSLVRAALSPTPAHRPAPERILQVLTGARDARNRSR
ncbi:serine/threonine-protein kinase [Nocardiopsis nanhaiensis]